MSDTTEATLSLDTPDRLLGHVMLRTIATQQEWVHRRVETARFMGGTRVRRSVSVDFDWKPLPTPPMPPSVQRAQLVPLAMLTKRPLMAFDLRDEVGMSVPILRREQNEWTAWSVLVAAAEGPSGEELDEDMISRLRDVVQSRRGDKSLLRELRDISKDDEDSVFPDLVADLADHFLLVAVLGKDTAGRRILKYSFDEEIPWTNPQRRALGLRRTFDLPTKMGWRATSFGFAIKRPGACGTYHMEIEAPEGIEIADLKTQTDPPLDGAVIKKLHTATRAHVYVSNASLATRLGVEVLFRAPARGLLRLALLVALLSTAVLTLGWQTPGVLAHAQERADAAAALLLALLGALAYLTARPGEHRVVSQMLVGVRVVGAVAGGLLPYIGGLLLVAGIAEGTLFEFTLRGISWTLSYSLVDAWGWLAFLAMLGTVSLVVSVGASVAAGRRQGESDE